MNLQEGERLMKNRDNRRLARASSMPRKRRLRNAVMGLESLEDRKLLTLSLPSAPDFPLVTYNSTGVTTYDAGTLSFDLNADPVFFRQSAASPVRTVIPPEDVQIHVQVDNAGNLIGGVPGDDLVVTGRIDLN